VANPEAAGTDIWAVGDAYEPYVGRWSRLVAREFLTWLDVTAGSRWLDVGCGTGALSGTILALAAPGEVVGIDPSAGFVAYARAKVTDPRARFEIADARALPESLSDVDVVVSGLVLNFLSDPAEGVSEMARVARTGGTVGAYVWDYSDGMELMRRFWDAVVQLDPAADSLDEGRRFAGICRPDALAALFTGAGVRHVESRAIDVQTHFRDFDDFWSPFLGGQGPAPAYVAELDGNHQSALRERLRDTLPTGADGSIRLTARAWAVRGVR
jgi:SAM-dependent methyltransferase